MSHVTLQKSSVVDILHYTAPTHWSLFICMKLASRDINLVLYQQDRRSYHPFYTYLIVLWYDYCTRQKDILECMLSQTDPRIPELGTP